MAQQQAKPVPAMQLIVQMANCVKYELTQIKHFQGRRIEATPKEAEIIRRQADAMKSVADQWAQIALDQQECAVTQS